MKINPSIQSVNTDRQIEKINQDQEKAEEIFKKMLSKEMLKGMMNTTNFGEKETSPEKEFQEEMLIEELSHKFAENIRIDFKLNFNKYESEF